MTTNGSDVPNYAITLAQLQDELAALDRRRQALQAAIASLTALVAVEESAIQQLLQTRETR